MTIQRYFTPQGAAIIGTYEKTDGMAVINGIDEKGEPEHEGTTKFFYDNQRTVRKDGKIVYLCEDGDEWTFDQLIPQSKIDNIAIVVRFKDGDDIHTRLGHFLRVNSFDEFFEEEIREAVLAKEPINGGGGGAAEWTLEVDHNEAA